MPEQQVINTHGMTVEFGKHRGTLYTRMPISYLKWMINANHGQADIAKAELSRRGVSLTIDLEISGHAINRASQLCIHLWERTRRPIQDDSAKYEGLHAWLIRLAGEALGQLPPSEGIEPKTEGVVIYQGLKLVFHMDGVWPVLKTVMVG